jgi:hypothetical protein
VDSYIPRPGDIGLASIPGYVGGLIRVGQWLNGDGYSRYEHAFVVVGPGTAPGSTTNPKMVEAMPRGALLSPVSKYDPGTVVYLRCPEQYRDAVAAAAREMIGVKYSVADYLALALHRAHIPTPLLKRYITNSKHLICSQLADLAADLGGWHLYDDGRWPGDVTPGDLWKLWMIQEAIPDQRGEGS